MYLSAHQMLIMIGAIALGAMVTRITPFLIFPEHKKPPKFILDLGKVLPAAMMGLLVVYCLKEVDITKGTRGIPEAIAIVGIILLHKWKSNVLLSILGGTAIYMVLIQCIM